MSEYINNSEKRVNDLLDFSLGIMNGEDGRELVEKYKDAINNVTPHDMLKLEDKQMQMGISPENIKKDVEKIINVFSKRLNKYQWKRPARGTFLFYLMLENDAYTFKLNQVKKIIKSYKGYEASDFGKLKKELDPKFREFESFDYHYVKKENILFPYLEENWDSYRPLKVMWSLHDDIRKMLKTILHLLADDKSEWTDFNVKLGKFFSLVFRMIQKENSIVFPVAAETVGADTWEQMHIQSFEYPFPFIETPQKPQRENSKGLAEENVLTSTESIVAETGKMSLEQTLMVLNHLPVDLTVVDETDKVLFFNKAKDRFFPRSPAIVGRSVQNCHPPESVHVVEKIIEAFRKGEKERADFWIQMKGRFILIQYFALRNQNGEYKGVLEVSQDATTLRNLKGEKRLLDWD
jgi:uncharacterized protein